MVRYTDIDQLIDKIEGTTWYHISKSGELVKGANSKDDIPLYKHSDIREVLNSVTIVDVVPRSEYDDLKMQFAELDIECSRLEKVEQKFDDYKRFVGEIRVTGDNHATIIVGENVEYIDKRVAEGLKNLAVKQAKQEFAREIFEELEEMSEIYEYREVVTWESIAELKKKYIGKDTDVPTNIGETK